MKTMNHTTRVWVIMLIIFLCLTLFDFAAKGSVFALPCLLILFGLGAYRLFNLTGVLLVIWCVIYYAVESSFRGYYAYEMYLLLGVFPSMYFAGKYLAGVNEEKKVARITMILGLALGLLTILSIWLAIVQFGFRVDMSERGVKLIGFTPSTQETMSATILSARMMPMLCCIGLLFCIPKTRFQKIFICLSLIVFVADLRVMSRTSVVFAVLLLIYSFFWNYNKIGGRKKGYVLIFLIVLVLAGSFVLENYSSELVILDRFQQGDLHSGGGRTELAEKVWNRLPDYPYGGMFMKPSIRYAHDLWFDCGRVAGYIPMILLALITIVFLLKLLVINKRRIIDKTTLFIINSLTLGIYIIFLTEPVLEGEKMLFAYFCFLLGVVDKYSCLRRKREDEMEPNEWEEGLEMEETEK